MWHKIHLSFLYLLNNGLSSFETPIVQETQEITNKNIFVLDGQFEKYKSDKYKFPHPSRINNTIQIIFCHIVNLLKSISAIV